MSIPKTAIELLDFTMEENKLDYIDTVIVPQDQAHGKCFGFASSLLGHKIETLVGKILDKQVCESTLTRGVKASFSYSYSNLCKTVFIRFLTSLIMWCIYDDKKNMRWIPTSIISQKLDGGVPETEKSYVRMCYLHTTKGIKQLGRFVTFKLIIGIVVDSFIKEWGVATNLCGKINFTKLDSESDLLEVFEKMLISAEVPLQSVGPIRRLFKKSVDCWQQIFVTKKQEECELRVLCRENDIECQRNECDKEAGRIDEYREEIERMQEKLKSWEQDHKKMTSKLKKSVKNLDDLLVQRGLYLLVGVSRQLRDVVIREATKTGGFNIETLVTFVRFIANKT